MEEVTFIFNKFHQVIFTFRYGEMRLYYRIRYPYINSEHYIEQVKKWRNSQSFRLYASNNGMDDKPHMMAELPMSMLDLYEVALKKAMEDNRFKTNPCPSF